MVIALELNVFELEAARQVLSRWRKRGTIPYEKLIDFSEANSWVSLSFILWGQVETSQKSDGSSPVVLDNFGTVSRLVFWHGGKADMSLGPQEIRRILEALIDYERARQHPDRTILKQLERLIDHCAEETYDFELIARAVIARHAARLVPEIPDG